MASDILRRQAGMTGLQRRAAACELKPLVSLLPNHNVTVGIQTGG
jgi:hypothetical protein